MKTIVTAYYFVYKLREDYESVYFKCRHPCQVIGSSWLVKLRLSYTFLDLTFGFSVGIVKFSKACKVYHV